MGTFVQDIIASDVYATNGSAVDLLCKAPVALDYCWFTDPSQRRISISDKVAATSTDQYTYFGTGLKLGECGLTIRTANLSDSGLWKCHVGTTTKSVGFEITRSIGLRISGKRKAAPEYVTINAYA